MTRKKRFIGVDLHTDNFVVCYRPAKGDSEILTFPMNEKGMQSFCKTLNKRDLVAVESTGNSSFFYKIVNPFVEKITVVATRQFKVIADSSKKTDRNDAETIAYYLSKNLLPTSRIKSRQSQILGSLIATRSNLIQVRTALFNRTHSLLITNGRKIPRSKLTTQTGFEKYVINLDWDEYAKLEIDIIHTQSQNITKAIHSIDLQLHEIASKVYGYQNLKSIGGIADLSAAILLQVIDDINDFDSPKKLSSYFGIVPNVRESNGVRKSTNITKRGSKIGRSTLVRCAYVSKRYNPYLGEFYDRIKSRGGSKKAAVATANKLLKIIYFTLKNDVIFTDFNKYEYTTGGAIIGRNCG